MRKMQTEEIAHQAIIDKIAKVFEPDLLLANEMAQYVLSRYGRRNQTTDGVTS